MPRIMLIPTLMPDGTVVMRAVVAPRGERLRKFARKLKPQRRRRGR